MPVCCLVRALQYLKTVVPYEPSSGAPTVERLQIYIKSKSVFRVELFRSDKQTTPSDVVETESRLLCMAGFNKSRALFRKKFWWPLPDIRIPPD